MNCKGEGCLEGVDTIVWVEAGHSYTGKGRSKVIPIDSCIADLVKALYPMAASSCCGHGQTEGRILLYDGRVLRIYQDKIIPDAMPNGPWGYNKQSLEEPAEAGNEIQNQDQAARSNTG